MRLNRLGRDEQLLCDPAIGFTLGEKGEDISGPCDEAEHANDPRCMGAGAVNDDQGENNNDQGENEDGDNSGPSANSGPGSSHDEGDDDSGHGGNSGPGGGDDD